MPTPITGTDTYPASFDIPSGGDTRNASSVNAALEALADRTEYLKNRVGGLKLMQLEDSISASAGATLATTSDNTYGTDPLEIGTVAVEDGDTVEVSVDVHVGIGFNPSTGSVKLYYVIGLDAPVDIPGAVNTLSEAFTTQKGVHVAGIAHPTSTGTMRVFLDQRVAGGETLIVVPPIAASIKVWRANT